MVKKNLKNLAIKSLKNLAIGLTGAITFGGISMGLDYAYQGLQSLEKKLKNTQYIKTSTKYELEKREFREKYIDAVKNHNVTYTHWGKNIPCWYFDLDGDKKFDGYILHLNGSTRGSNDIGIYPLKNKKD